MGKRIKKTHEFENASKDDKTLFDPEKAFKNSQAAMFCCLFGQTAVVPLMLSSEEKKTRALITCRNQ